MIGIRPVRSRHSQLVHWRVLRSQSLSRHCFLRFLSIEPYLLFCFEGVSLSARYGRSSHTVLVPLPAACRPRQHGGAACCASPFENCRASTSIFVLPSYKEPTVDALAPRTDEGRGRLRKATGSCLPSVDPWISEWGNPALVMECYSGLNT